LQRGARIVLAIQAEEAERLWSSSGEVAALRQEADAHVDAALDSPLALDAFRRQAGTHHALTDSDVGRLLGRITELRYLRSDVHAQSLAEEGLSGPTARTMHRLWRGFGREEPVDGSLVGRGLVEIGPEGSIATTRGVETCERVERATNVEFAALFGSLGDDRSSALLDGMRLLAGEDPRPLEDR
jgi:hypothetical protein